MRARGLVAAVLAAAVFAVFAQVRNHAFVDYDDPLYLAAIHGGTTADALARAWTDEVAANWIPVTMTLLVLEREIYGDTSAGYLLTNVALHAVSSVVLFFVLASASGALWPSAFVAGVFGLHPLHVESVAWFSQRKDVLCGLFWMLTLAAYVRYARRPSARRYLPVLLCTALGLLSKPMLMTAPFTLLLLDYWPLERLRPEKRALLRTVGEKLPLFALAAIVAAVAYLTQAQASAIAGDDLLPLHVRLANAAESYVAYVLRAVCPADLAAYYPHPRGVEAPARAAAAAALLALASYAAVRGRSARPYALMGWLWYVGTLLPVIGLVQVGQQARADRYTYVPLVGLAIAVAWGAAALVRRRPHLRWAVAGGGLVGLVALAIASQHQAQHWKDSLALYRRAVAVTRANPLAHRGLGRALRRAGQTDEAAVHLSEAIRLRPHWARPRVDMAELLAERGERDAAIAQYARAVEIAPEDLRVRVNLASLLVRAGRTEEARAQLAHCAAELRAGALLPEPFRAALHEGLGETAADRSQAIAHYRDALAADSNRTRAANNLAWLLATAPDLAPGTAAEAVRLAESAARRTGYREAAILDTLAAAYAADGRHEAAVEYAARALHVARARPDDPRTQAIRVRLALYRAGERYVEW
jgi:tetratricopeptide (TPR) repeat protein